MKTWILQLYNISIVGLIDIKAGIFLTLGLIIGRLLGYLFHKYYVGYGYRKR